MVFPRDDHLIEYRHLIRTESSIIYSWRSFYQVSGFLSLHHSLNYCCTVWTADCFTFMWSGLGGFFVNTNFTL